MDDAGALWNLGTGRDESRHRPPRDDDWMPLALSQDERLALLSAIAQNVTPVGLWEPATGSKVKPLSGHPTRVMTGALTEGGRRVITGDEDGMVRIWDTSSTKELETLRGHEAGVQALAVSADDRRAVSGDGEGRVILWGISR